MYTHTHTYIIYIYIYRGVYSSVFVLGPSLSCLIQIIYLILFILGSSCLMQQLASYHSVVAMDTHRGCEVGIVVHLYSP